MTKHELETLRDEIQTIDAELLEMVARRLEVAKEIGLVKDKDGLRIRDPAREKTVFAEYVSKATSLGIDEDIASRLAITLVEASVRVQKGSKSRDLKSKTALIVGGAGKMGEWTARFLSNRGAEVLIWDRRGKLDGYKSVKSLEQTASKADIVVVGSPPGTCQEELQAVLDSRPEGLVFDLCSVKSHISGNLRRGAKNGLRVTSVHTMFGPKVPTPKNQNVVICDCGCPKANELASSLFSKAGARVSIVDLERHDELMTYVLGLSHLCTLIFAGTVARSGNEISAYADVMGPTFGKMSRMARELSKESKRVYHDIQALNPHTRQMIANMEIVTRELRRASLDADPGRFGKIMESDKMYFEVR
jgi:chorismate mutase/prephenate dehydrogenase